MYHFSYFKETDKNTILRFLNEHPFALITGKDATGRLVATQIPILVEERNGDWYLQGHIMRNTDHHKAFEDQEEVLVVFTGPDTYVSASWYTQPDLGSTWNYMSVHIRGKVSFMSNEALVNFMRKLTLTFEKGNTDSPTIYDNLPTTFLQKMMPGIAGFEIKVEEMENVFKLSQNRDEQSYRNIMEELHSQGGDASLIADEMQNRLEQLFPPGVEWDANKFAS